MQMVNQVDAEILNAVLTSPMPTPLEMFAHCVREINSMLPPGRQQQQQKTFDGYCFRCGGQGHMSQACMLSMPPKPQLQGSDQSSQVNYITFPNTEGESEHAALSGYAIWQT